jgi:hypothetical protein
MCTKLKYTWMEARVFILSGKSLILVEGELERAAY